MTRRIIQVGLVLWAIALGIYVAGDRSGPAQPPPPDPDDPTENFGSVGAAVDSRSVNALTTVLGEPFLSESAPTAILIVNADCAACRAYKETYAGIQADAERTGMEFRLVVTNDLPKTLDFAPEGVGPRISDPTGHVYRLLDHWFVPSLAIVEGETISSLHTPFNEDWPPPGAFAPSD